jgi:hypothetical protein
VPDLGHGYHHGFWLESSWLASNKSERVPSPAHSTITRSMRSNCIEPVLCCSTFSLHMPASLALAVEAATAAEEPPFSAIALSRAASISAIRLSIVTFGLLVDSKLLFLQLSYSCSDALCELTWTHCAGAACSRPPHTLQRSTSHGKALERTLHAGGWVVRALMPLDC